MKKIFKNILTAGTLAIVSACSNFGSHAGFNAAYVGVNSKQEEGYTRVFTNLDVGNDFARVHAHGLNEISGSDDSKYFGRNSLGIELGNGGIEAIVEARGDNAGLFSGQPQYGLRDNISPKMLGVDYGFFQATTNGEDGNLTIFCGKNLGGIAETLKPLSFEIFNSYDYRNDSTDSNLTEFTVDWSISKNLSFFIRQDTHDLNFDDSNYIIGGAIRF